MEPKSLSLDISQQIDIKAPIGGVFKGLLHRFGPGNTTPSQQPLPLVLEAWPGGRWFRDLEGGNGHLWGHVQVIKPPTLLEFSGPLFMSYPALNHLSMRLTEIAGGTRVALRHQTFGVVASEHREGIATGWEFGLSMLKRECE